ncbi:MAG: bifunctional DNA-formamidopyrimidine glycosylase/DNA-(apurinic or apyrimidinic site) lyase [Desulfobulbus sp.]|nr:bifunctional DNA-formamidopyrimidine glycosylase/DNA-(apurinic or apyrimidinic site) lyase [Desulfobulbus sp.]
MPELPEVEVVRRGLLPYLSGKTVTAVATSKHRLRHPVPVDLLTRHIHGQTFLTVHRRAKYLLLRMTNGAVLVIHLGMTGKLSVLPLSTAFHKHDHLLLSLDSDSELRLNDSRRFGTIMVWPASEALTLERSFFAKTGIEPFDPGLTTDHLYTLSCKRVLPIKSLLMNGQLIAGIGNIYANEILFAARIHPETPARFLHRNDWQRIIVATRQILQEAIEAGGSTIGDFLNASGHPGYFQFHFKVYRQEGTACPICAHSIVKMTLAGRATYFCPSCQPART